jgi:hypothetical protein
MGDRDMLVAFDGELDELARLTKANCKPLILSLTMIAEESAHAAPALVGLICRKIQTVAPDRLLTIVYLWDSISQSKRAGRFRELFAPRLIPTLGAAFDRAPAAVRANLQKLFDVWRAARIYLPNLLDELDARVRRAGGGGGAAPPGGPSGAAGADAFAAGPTAPAQPAAAPPPPFVPPPEPPPQLALRHLGRAPAALSKLPPQMAALRRAVAPFVGAPNPNAELLRDTDELVRMYEYVLALEGDGAVIAGRSTLVAELAELTQWRAGVESAAGGGGGGGGGGEASAQAQALQQLPAQAQPLQLSQPAGAVAARGQQLQPAGGAAGAAGGRRAAAADGGDGGASFPAGPCAHIFELFAALSQLDMLPLPTALAVGAPTGGGGGGGGGGSGGGAARARAPALVRPFDRRLAIHRLYESLPLQCPLSGVRFARGGHRQLRAHMDVRFKRAHRAPGGPPPSRSWLRPAAEWLAQFGSEQEHITRTPGSFFGENGDAVAARADAAERGGGGGGAAAAAAARSTALPAPVGVDLSALTCALSGEPLESFYDAIADEWMIRDAVALPDGRICHLKSLS